MFGIGFLELGVIGVVAMVVFGPERLPDVARQAARMLNQARKMAQSARDELRSELGPEYADLELRDLDPRQIVRKHIIEAMEDIDGEDDDVPAGLQPLLEGERPPYDLEAT
ncbi:Sec-independent protein translocase protein TatB [Nocardioides fonticola]|uniref:Sec-independent protein translocase protein TatB n=1 Tax=Nocardioides fonticola TaxID=450363 RepID=A0ABP7XE75_9ACTN